VPLFRVCPATSTKPRCKVATKSSLLIHSVACGWVSTFSSATPQVNGKCLIVCVYVPTLLL
jgi:hypothetical protein